MPLYTIDIGAVANDGTGDPLRTAFNEVNLNFEQVFTAGPVLSNIQIANNTILTTNTNGNLVLAPNGVGVVQANVNIVPNTSNIRNLGAADRRWSTLYIQYANVSGSLTVADLTATGNVTVGGNLSVTGNVINVGNIITDAKTIQLANTAGTANAASGSGITVGANDAIATMLYSSSSNAWVMNIGIDTPNIVVNNISSDDSTFVTIQDGLDVQGDVTAETVSVTGNITANYFLGNGSQLTGVSNYANANAVAYGQAGWAGNIVPAASNTYSLGNSTNWWSNVWVAGNTMYIGGVPIGMGAGNTLTVDGNSVVTVSSNTTANLANIGIDNNNIFNNQGQGVVISNFSFIDEAETAYVQIPAGNSTANLNIVQKQGNVRIAANAAAWLFDDTGNLTLPTNGSIVVDGGDGVIGPVSDDLVISWDNEEIRLVSVQGSIEMQADAAFRVQTNYDGANVLYASRWEFGNNELVNISNNFGIVSEAGNLTLSGGRDGVNSGNTMISAVNLGTAVYNWTFGNDGNLNLPSEGNIVGVTANNAGRLQWVGNSSGDGAGYTTLGLIPDETLVGNDQYLIIDPTAPGHIHIRAGGTQDNSNADLFLGGENSHFKVNAGANSEVRISANSWPWTFGADGAFTLPANAGLNGSQINSVANSSGDGAGYTTLQLVPDVTIGTGTDQYVILDPTAPGHIHIRAGGTQDASSADLFLGGENSHVKIAAGANSDVVVRSNSNNWTFDTLGVLTLPGEGVLRSIGDVVTLQSINISSGNANSVYLGSSGGLGFFDQEIGGNWLEIFRSGAEPEIRVPVGRGNLNIQTAQGNNVYNWTFDNTGNLTAPGAISTTGNITAGNFIGSGSNVDLVAGAYDWTFDSTGNLTTPQGMIVNGNVNFLGTDTALIKPADNTGLSLFSSGANGTITSFWTDDVGNLMNSNIAAIYTPLQGTQTVRIVNGNNGGNVAIYDFDNTGMFTTATVCATGNVYAGNVSASGNITGGNVSVSGNITGNTAGYTIGYLDIPQVTFSANATAALTDAGKHYYSTTAGNLVLTLPDNSNVAFPTGATLTVVVNAAGNVLVNQGTGVTLYQAGASATGNRVVGAYGLASVMKVAANTWVISGTGVY